MRFLSLILVLAASGCHLGGGGSAKCQTEPGNQAASNCQDCQDCQGDCENGCGQGCGGWCGCNGWFCFGRHASYHEIKDSIHTSQAARWLARTDLRTLDNDQCLTCDYRLGFEQAYVDVAHGADGVVPPLPPANYWKLWARSPEGHQRAQQWFAGYAAGAAQARYRYEPFNEVASSGQPDYGWSGVSGVVPVGYGPAPEQVYGPSP